ASSRSARLPVVEASDLLLPAELTLATLTGVTAAFFSGAGLSSAVTGLESGLAAPAPSLNLDGAAWPPPLLFAPKTSTSAVPGTATAEDGDSEGSTAGGGRIEPSRPTTSVETLRGPPSLSSVDALEADSDGEASPS